MSKVIIEGTDGKNYKIAHEVNYTDRLRSINDIYYYLNEVDGKWSIASFDELRKNNVEIKNLMDQLTIKVSKYMKEENIDFLETLEKDEKL